MAQRTIISDSDPILQKKSREVTVFSKRLHELLDDMKETLQNANGMGLAAVQVGVLRRVFIIHQMGENEKIIEFVNPKIKNRAGEYEDWEGCLSVPGKRGLVKRPYKTVIKAFDRYGNPFIYEGEEIYSRALCHEHDHLEGILYSSIASELISEEELLEREEAAAEEGQE